jgi:hypothetical protein
MLIRSMKCTKKKIHNYLPIYVRNTARSRD